MTNQESESTEVLAQPLTSEVVLRAHVPDALARSLRLLAQLSAEIANIKRDDLREEERYQVTQSAPAHIKAIQDMLAGAVLRMSMKGGAS